MQAMISIYLFFSFFRYYKTLFLIFSIIFPTAVPCLLWNETIWNSFFISFILRLAVGLNFTWLVNSAAHIYGTRPFSKYVIYRILNDEKYSIFLYKELTD